MSSAAIDNPRLHANLNPVAMKRSLMPQVEIYTKMMCPYCVRAKRLLDEKGVDFKEYDITLGGPKRAEMLERSNGGYTVPQIFIDGRHIGGSDDLAALDSVGKLDPLLKS
jgi:glutaredoxin 3